MTGMNPEACASYSLAGRFHCGTCGGTPQLLSAEGRDPITVSLSCCGQKLVRSYTRAELTFTQIVFEKDEA